MKKRKLHAVATFYFDCLFKCPRLAANKFVQLLSLIRCNLQTVVNIWSKKDQHTVCCTYHTVKILQRFQTFSQIIIWLTSSLVENMPTTQMTGVQSSAETVYQRVERILVKSFYIGYPDVMRYMWPLHTAHCAILVIALQAYPADPTFVILLLVECMSAIHWGSHVDYRGTE